MDPKKPKKEIIRSDALFKRIMENPAAAKEFLEYYLPENFKSWVDLDQISLEKESYIEDNLIKGV